MEKCSIWRDIEHCNCQRGSSASWIVVGFSKKNPFFFFVMHGLHYFMAALLSWCLYERLANTTVVFGHVCIALCSLYIDLSFLAIRSAKHSGHMVE